MKRNTTIASFFGLWFGAEIAMKVPYFRSMAHGWKFLSALGVGLVATTFMMSQTSQWYKPLFSAYFRKYKDCIKTDPFEIQDEKKKYFYIDTSQYMNYTIEDLSEEYHTNHGPQPVSYF